MPLTSSIVSGYALLITLAMRRVPIISLCCAALQFGRLCMLPADVLVRRAHKRLMQKFYEYLIQVLCIIRRRKQVKTARSAIMLCQKTLQMTFKNVAGEQMPCHCGGLFVLKK